MAPEVVNHQPGGDFNALAADIYSLGITIFVLLTGEFPNPQEIKTSMSTNDSEKHPAMNMEVDSNSPMKSG